MHDPLVVAFTVIWPWPQRSSLPASGNGERWRVLLHHVHHDDCAAEGCTGNPFPWWRPRSWSRFWRLAGRDFYWPSLVTIWHREPGGHDSGEVCRHYQRVFDKATRTWGTRTVRRWRWHVHHWKVQVHPFQDFRRWALTRCAWCGGRSRKGDCVNFSHQWDGPQGHWWRGEPGLFHEDCSAVDRAHSLCLCPELALARLDSGFGDCLTCGKFHPWRHEPDEADRILASLPDGSRITPDIRPRIEVAWAQRRAWKVASDG